MQRIIKGFLYARHCSMHLEDIIEEKNTLLKINELFYILF